MLPQYLEWKYKKSKNAHLKMVLFYGHGHSTKEIGCINVLFKDASIQFQIKHITENKTKFSANTFILYAAVM